MQFNIINILPSLKQIRVGYKRPKNFKLTPNRKHLGKAVARRSKKTIAVQCLKDQDIRKYVLKLIEREVHNEVKALCSNDADSILQQSDPEVLKSFKWNTLMSELVKYTPILKGLLESTGIPRRNRPNFDAVVCLCIALLARNRNQRMNLVAKILSLIMYAGHSSKEVSHLYNKLPLHDPQLFMQTFSRLGRLNLTVSHTSLIRLLDRIGATFDEKTRMWREELLDLLMSSETAVSNLIHN